MPKLPRCYRTYFTYLLDLPAAAVLMQCEARWCNPAAHSLATRALHVSQYTHPYKPQGNISNIGSGPNAPSHPPRGLSQTSCIRSQHDNTSTSCPSRGTFHARLLHSPASTPQQLHTYKTSVHPCSCSWFLAALAAQHRHLLRPLLHTTAKLSPNAATTMLPQIHHHIGSHQPLAPDPPLSHSSAPPMPGSAA
jgi:hypothetical protein